MSRVRTKVTLPLAGLILTTALLILAACGGGGSAQSGNGSRSGNGTSTATTSGQASQSNAPLPSDVPAPPNASLQREYTTQVNGQTATIWQYTIPASSSATPNNVASVYQQQMPANGWRTTTSSSDPGALVTSGIYQKAGSLASVSAAYTHGNYGPIAVIITVAGK